MSWVISARTFFHRYFVRELIRFSRLAYIVSTKDSKCFIGSFSAFAFYKWTVCTTWQRYQNQNKLKKGGDISSVPFYRRFLRELIGFSIVSHIVSTIDSWCFIRSFQTLHLTIVHTALPNSVVRIKIGSRMWELFPNVCLFMGIL